MEEQRKVPLAQIADALGISRTTVCRALSGKGRVNPETVRRVREYLLDHGADPAGHTGPLAAVLAPGLGLELLTALCAAAQRRNRELMVLPDDTPQVLVRRLQMGRALGVLLPAGPCQSSQAHTLAAAGIPVVLLGGAAHADLPQLALQDGDSLRELAELLRLKGVQRIVLLTERDGNEIGIAWKQIARPLEAVIVWESMGLDQALNRALAAVPDCLLFVDPRTAYDAFYLLKGRGIAVPQALYMACLQDAPCLAQGEVSVTALHWDQAALAEAALALLTGAAVQPPSGMLVLRRSTRR